MTSRRSFHGWALLGAVLLGCGGSARSSSASTRGISDPVPGQECEGPLEFVALGTLPQYYDNVWVRLDRSSQRAVWSFRSGQHASSFHWSRAQGTSELRDDALQAMWNPPAEVSFLQVISSSADASVGAGVSSGSNGSAGFRWSESGELSPLDLLPHAINPEGTVIAGVQGDGQMARWTPAGGVEPLGVPQAVGMPLLLSAAGDVIAGNEADGPCHRWTAATGAQDLGLLPGMTTCIAVLMNDSGDVVVGAMQATPGGPTRIFRWTLARGIQHLQLGDGDAVSAWPRAMNADGSFIAVELDATDGSFSRFGRWTEAHGAEEIEPGTDLTPTYVSPLGDAVIGTVMDSTVGQVGDTSYLESFRWTEADGLQRLGVADVGLALEGKLMVGIGPSGPEIRKFGELGSSSRLMDLLPPGIVPEGWSDAHLDGISEDGGMLFGDALNPAGERQLWLQHLACP